jgi:hypothetical protein
VPARSGSSKSHPGRVAVTTRPPPWWTTPAPASTETTWAGSWRQDQEQLLLTAPGRSSRIRIAPRPERGSVTSGVRDATDRRATVAPSLAAHASPAESVTRQIGGCSKGSVSELGRPETCLPRGSEAAVSTSVPSGADTGS